MAKFVPITATLSHEHELRFKDGTVSPPSLMLA